MLYFSKTKVLLIFLAIFFASFFALPNIFNQNQLNNFPVFIPNQKVNLGLDLQGGSHLLLEVDTKEIIKERTETLSFDLRKLLKKNNCVIALGGGAFINKSIRKSILKNCVSIWLDANANILTRRVKWNNKRPLLNNENIPGKINKLYAERKNLYKMADHKIICDRLNKIEIAKKIIFFYDKKKNNS